jgi:hypothetical protein
MDEHPLDNPIILSLLFYPRTARAGTSQIAGTRDGTVKLPDGDALGYRLYAPPQPARWVIVYFHGNGEIASDHDGMAPLYFAIGAAVLVVDYRGYGWSTGHPRVTTLLPDAIEVVNQLDAILKPAGLEGKPRCVMGRSLGSAPAVHLAARFPEMFKGIIVESGFADMPSVVRRLGIPVDLSSAGDLPLANDRALAELDLPLLVLHGENDNLLPVSHGQRLYDVSAAEDKSIVRVPGAGHNDILFIGKDVYFTALGAFLDRVLED